MTNGRRTTRCAPAASPVPLGLTRRRHIDLARVAGATCR
ncbi:MULTISPECIES: putative leader peptide [unclassified Streptomyces]|nr:MULTISPECIES: putative leader peptide [unclassified Streptomyces]